MIAHKRGDKELKYLTKDMPNLKLRVYRLVGMQQMIGAIWNYLVKKGYSHKEEYYCVLSDDSLLQTQGWLSNMVKSLKANDNIGVVSFTEVHKIDRAGSWPTFPMFHKTHLEIFSPDAAFDTVFRNSYVDIWISDVYIAFGLATIVSDAVLLNVVGGQDAPRYRPTFPGWNAYIGAVERGRQLVASWLKENRAEFTIDDSRLKYGEEGYHYRDYCKDTGLCEIAGTDNAPSEPSDCYDESEDDAVGDADPDNADGDGYEDGADDSDEIHEL